MPVGHFLVGVGALIYDPDSNRYLLLRRSDQKDVGAGSWECPTGRVDQGEGIEDAVVREVMEEIGVVARPQFIIGTTHFYRGAAVPENELVGVLYECRIENAAQIKISDEHSEVRWMTWPEIDAFLPVDHWLRWVINRAELMRSQVSDSLRKVFDQEGFEVGGRNLYR